MKIRVGFVTNSSSTSYIVGVPQIMKDCSKAVFTELEVREMIRDYFGIIEDEDEDTEWTRSYFDESMKLLGAGLGVMFTHVEHAGCEDFLSFCKDVGLKTVHLGD